MPNIFLNADCMDPEVGLPSYPDNHFDLAIVDPPYGINIANKFASASGKMGKAARKSNFKHSDWDKSIPAASYFSELQRVSKSQIIWGWNYFTNYLPTCQCYIVWNKRTNGNFGDCESAFTSFSRPPIVFEFVWNGMIQGDMKNKEARTHPTQKPKKLYQRTLQDFAKPNDLILDTHVGSASSLIACESMGFSYVGYELDPDYYAAAQNRMSKGIQLQML
jgi:site-specific DNA-methyltransferase (adenine-specific)